MYMRCYGGGRWELTHDDLLEVHTIMVRDRLMDIVFYDGSCRQPGDFVRFARSDANLFFVVYDDDNTPMAAWWLTDFSGRAARIHFCVFRRYFRQSFDIGEAVCHYVLDSQYLDALYGITPECNRAAVRFIKTLGFRQLATLPHAVDFNGRIVSGVLTIKERDDGQGHAERTGTSSTTHGAEGRDADRGTEAGEAQ